MGHEVYRVVEVEVVGRSKLRVKFDGDTEQAIDFSPVLEGEIFGPLKDKKLFEQVEIDAEAHTLVWPNGADFDPETLHDWPKYKQEMKRLAQRWAAAEAQA